jgi:uncharacterized Zn finger protein
MDRREDKPAKGTFRARLEVTSRSGWVTREYRLLLRPGRITVAYADGGMSYDVAFDPALGEATCTCPAFDADGHCKHLDALLALLEGLAGRLGRRVIARGRRRAAG